MIQAFVLHGNSTRARSIGSMPLYGRSCGPGYGHKSYPPSDPLDKCCYYHDICHENPTNYACRIGYWWTGYRTIHSGHCGCDQNVNRCASRVSGVWANLVRQWFLWMMRCGGCSTTTSPRAVRWVRQSNICYDRGDLPDGAYSARSITECATACINDFNCYVFTWVKGWKKCYLKKNSGLIRKRSSSCDSGYISQR